MKLDVNMKKTALQEIRSGLGSQLFLEAVSGEKYQGMEECLAENLALGIPNVHYVEGAYGTGKTTLLSRLAKFYTSRTDTHLIATRITGEKYGASFNYLMSLFLLDGKLPEVLRTLTDANSIIQGLDMHPQVRLLLTLAARVPVEQDRAFTAAAYGWLRDEGITPLKQLALAHELAFVGHFDKRNTPQHLVPTLARVLTAGGKRLVVMLDELDGIKLFQIARQEVILDAFRVLYDDAVRHQFDLYLFATPDLTELKRYTALAERLLNPYHLVSVKTVMWTTSMFLPTPLSYLRTLYDWHQATLAGTAQTLSFSRLNDLANPLFAHNSIRTAARDALALMDMYYLDQASFETACSRLRPQLNPTPLDDLLLPEPAGADAVLSTPLELDAYDTDIITTTDLLFAACGGDAVDFPETAADDVTLPLLHERYVTEPRALNGVVEGLRKCTKLERFGLLLGVCRDLDVDLVIRFEDAPVQSVGKKVSHLVKDVVYTPPRLLLTLVGYRPATSGDRDAVFDSVDERLTDLCARTHCLENLYLEQGASLVRAFVYKECARRRIYMDPLIVDTCVLMLLENSNVRAPRTVSRTGVAFKKKWLFRTRTEWLNPEIEVLAQIDDEALMVMFEQDENENVMD